MGIILALSFTFIAFEYDHADVTYPNFDAGQEINVEIDYISITNREIKKLPPHPTLITVLFINPFNGNIDEDIEILSVEIDNNTEIPIYNYDDPLEIDNDRIWTNTEKNARIPRWR